MSNKQEDNAADHAQCLLAKFALLDTILFDQREGISKRQDGIVEADCMLAQVASGFGFIPLKPDYTIPSVTP